MFSSSSEMNVNLCSINCRGLKDPSRLNQIISQCCGSNQKLQNLILHVQETKIEKLTTNHLKVFEKFHLQYEFVPAENMSGGLLSVFPKSLRPKLVRKSSCMIFIEFENFDGLFANVYIKPSDYSLQQFETDFKEIEKQNSENIFLSGDLNALADESCSSNPNIMPNDFRLLRFRKILNIMGLLSLNHVAPASNRDFFTHFDKRSGTFSQIDHVFTNKSNCNFVTKTLAFSDHRLIVLSWLDETFFRPSYWKLNDNVLRHHSLIQSIICDSYQETNDNRGTELDNHDYLKNMIREKLRSVCIQDTHKEKFEEHSILKELEKTEDILARSRSDGVLLKQLSDLTSQLAKIQERKSRKDLKQMKNFFTDFHNGDSHSVKNHLNRKKAKTRIQTIKINPNDVTCDEDRINQEFVDHFTQRFSKPFLSDDQKESKMAKTHQVISEFCSKKGEQINEIRDICSTRGEILELEVKLAIQKLNPDSAPGLDGLTSNFYKAHSDFFIPYLCRIYNQAFSEKRVPVSFRNAVVKFIPKKDKSEKVEDFRPISLINTDQKILSHILTARIVVPFSKIINSHQTAHLPNRSIHSSLIKVNVGLENFRSSDCLVAVDFSKAFDKIDRDFLFLLLEAISIDERTLSLIKATYDITVAFLDINGFLSHPIKMENGVRQGCPLSALLFNLGIEPLLLSISDSEEIQSDSMFKVIAYADDLTCCIKKESFDALMTTLNSFSEVTNLTLNNDKTEILCHDEMPNGVQKVATAKILGVNFKIGDSKIDMPSVLAGANKCRMYCNKFNSLIARAKNIETFVMQKLIHQVRHKTALKNQLERIDNVFVDAIWLGRKHNLKKSILQKPWSVMGIALKNFTQVVVASKLFDLKNFLTEGNDGTLIEVIRKTTLLRNLKSLIRTFHCNLLFNDRSEVELQKESNSLILTPQTRTKEIYRFLNDSNNSESYQRITKIASKINCPPEQIFTFIRRLWKHGKYAAFEKNYLYQFFMNCYLEKTKKLELGWVPDCFCCFCGTAEESHSHLLFECSSVPNLNFFNVSQPISLNFLDPGDIYPFKRLIALLISSWSSDKSKFFAYFLDCLSLRNPFLSHH